MLIIDFLRILQKDFDDTKRDDIVVNSVYPATRHKEIDQTPETGWRIENDEDAAK